MLKKYFTKTEDMIKTFLTELYQHKYNEVILEELLEKKKFSIDYQDPNGNSFLHLCLMKEKFKSALWLIEHGADVKIENKKKETPIFLIIEKNHTVLLEFIINNKLVDIDKKDEFGRTLLQNAVVLGYSDMAKVLIEHGANINSVDNNNRNVLFDALSFGDKSFIKYLLSYEHLELNYLDINKNSIMHHPQVMQEDDNAIELIQAGADATIKNKDGETFLCNSALRGIEADKIVQTALDVGNDVNSRVNNNNSILMELVAAASKLTEEEKSRRKSLLKIARVFVDRGIDINAIDNNHETALFRAVRNNDFEQTSFLLSAGINPNVINKRGETVLTIAVLKGILYIDVILLLLKYGADPKIKNNDQKTIYEILNELILHTHNKKNIEDTILLDSINPSGQYLVVLKEILNHYKNDLDIYDSQGDPIFFEPLLEDHFPMFKLYIQNGVKINKRNKDGYNLFYKYVLKVFEDDNEDIAFQNNLSVLLSSKLDQNIQDETGYTVVHKIMHTSCNPNLFETLTDVVLFDYKRQDNLGRSVIHAGVWNNQTMSIRRIYNIDKNTVNIADCYGILPITYAALLGNQDLVLLFLSLRANIKSNIKIPKNAIEKFSPMLKNLQKLKTNLEDLNMRDKMEKVIYQVKRDFGVVDQNIY